MKKEFNGYEIYEVKNCPSVEEQFIRDVGFQKNIVEKCGVVGTKCFIVYHGNDKAMPTLPLRNYAKKPAYRARLFTEIMKQRMIS